MQDPARIGCDHPVQGPVFEYFREETMNKKLGLTLAALMTTGSFLATPAAMAADFVMKISSPAPITKIDPLSAWMEAFEAGVEAKSGGRIDVQLYPSSQLGPIPATVEGVVMGTIEMTTPAIGFLSSVDPRFQVLDADGLFDDEHHALKTLSDPKVRAMLAEFGSKANIEPLFILTSGQMVLVSKDKIDGPAAMKGKKIRTAGATPLVNKPMEAFGVSPVAMPLGDVLPGIQTGTIDGATINMPVAVGFKFADVAKEAMYLPGKYTIIGGIISKDFLARIGPDLEKIVRDEAVNANAAYAAKLDSGPKILDGVWIKQGGEITRLEGAARDAYLATTTKEVEAVIDENPQMKADYAVLKSAAAASR